MTNEFVFDIIICVTRKYLCDFAAMAQLVEHILGKDEVPGPNPGSSSRQPRREIFGALAFYRDFAVLRWEYFFVGVVRSCYPFLTGLCGFATESGSHTPTEDLQDCLQGVGRGYLRLGEYPGRLQTFSLRLGHARGKTILNRFLTPSRRFATRCGSVTLGGKRYLIVF